MLKHEDEPNLVAPSILVSSPPVAFPRKEDSGFSQLGDLEEDKESCPRHD